MKNDEEFKKKAKEHVNLFTKILQNGSENHGQGSINGMNSVENMLFRKTKEQAYREAKVVNKMENAMA